MLLYFTHRVPFQATHGTIIGMILVGKNEKSLVCHVQELCIAY